MKGLIKTSKYHEAKATNNILTDMVPTTRRSELPRAMLYTTSFPQI